MRIIEVIIEATDPIGVNTVVGNHIEDPNIGEGDNKTITGANTKATMGNLTPPVDANCFLLVSAMSGPFTSFLVLHTISWFSRSEVCAFVLGNICERFALRDLC